MTPEEQFDEWYSLARNNNFMGPILEPIVREAFFKAYSLGKKQGMEESANISPNGLDINASDMPHVVWKKYQNAIRQAAEEIK